MSEPEQDRSDKFTLSPLGTVMTQCVYCTQQRPGFRPTCNAFPAGVPDEILTNKFDHRREVVGDQGVRFEPRPDVDPIILAQLYRKLDQAP